jgi:hypothetical protein
MLLMIALFKPKAVSDEDDSANISEGVCDCRRLRNVRQPMPGVRNRASQYFN